MEQKTFAVERARHGKLADLYMLMPSMIEVFGNVVHDEPLDKGVLSQHAAPTLRGIIAEYVVPVFLEYGLVRRDESRQCGFATDYRVIKVEDLDVKDMLAVTSMRAQHIASSHEPTDSRENLLSANLSWRSVTPTARKELLDQLRSVLKHFLAVPEAATSEGEPFRLCLIARGEPKGAK